MFQSYALLAMTTPRSAFLLPLIIVISLVYSASRYESPERILRRAVRLALEVTGLLAVVFAVLFLASYGL